MKKFTLSCSRIVDLAVKAYGLASCPQSKVTTDILNFIRKAVNYLGTITPKQLQHLLAKEGIALNVGGIMFKFELVDGKVDVVNYSDAHTIAMRRVADLIFDTDELSFATEIERHLGLMTILRDAGVHVTLGPKGTMSLRSDDPTEEFNWVYNADGTVINRWSPIQDDNGEFWVNLEAGTPRSASLLNVVERSPFDLLYSESYMRMCPGVLVGKRGTYSIVGDDIYISSGGNWYDAKNRTYAEARDILNTIVQRAHSRAPNTDAMVSQINVLLEKELAKTVNRPDVSMYEIDGHTFEFHVAKSNGGDSERFIVGLSG